MYLYGRDGRERQGPAVDSLLRSATLSDIRGDPMALPPVGQPALVLFMSTDCRLCSRLRDSVVEFALNHKQLLTLVVCAGQVSQVETWGESLDPVPVAADPQHAIAARYGIGMTPFVVGIRADGTVALRGLFNDADGLELAAEQLERELGLRRDELPLSILTATT